MKLNKLTLIIGLILVLAVAIEGFYIFDLRQQINNDKTSSPDTVNKSALTDDWFKGHDDNLFDLFSDFDDMQRDMDQLFGRFSLNFRGNPHFESVFGDYTSSPAVDFIEEDDQYVIEVDLPGTENSAVDVSIENGMLSIQAETIQQADKDKSTYRRSERYAGKLKRSLSVPPDADPDRMETQLDNGVLRITIPKRS